MEPTVWISSYSVQPADMNGLNMDVAVFLARQAEHGDLAHATLEQDSCSSRPVQFISTFLFLCT